MRRPITITFTLEELRAAGIDISQHVDTPAEDEWFTQFHGDSFPTAKAAALATIKRVCELRSEYEDEPNAQAHDAV